MLAKRAEHRYMGNIEPFLRDRYRMNSSRIAALLTALDSGELSINELSCPGEDEGTLALTIAALSQSGFLEFVTKDSDAVTLTPSSHDFAFGPIEPLTEGIWKLSRFTYSHLDGDEFVVRNPNADCFLKMRGDDEFALFYAFRKPTHVNSVTERLKTPHHSAAVCGALARAAVILRCDQEGKTLDETNRARRQWSFHDLVFHSLCRLGRTEKEIGGTYRFKGEFPSPPAVKAHPWKDKVISLPHANIQALMQYDMPLAAAMETRRSTRQHSIVPLSKQELGEFLFRVARVRRQYTNEHGDFTSRPYPGGGALYESEFYLTIDACLDVERGFYYYDPVAHALCLVSQPSPDTKALLDEACLASAMMCRPQVLVTIASRFNRFNWKYASMAYSAQLKNVGVIYQTMYLVATAMNIGACALGIGNSDRFARITGLDYLEEGSIGEFMLGRPL